jgi:hypothetical protein
LCLLNLLIKFLAEALCSFVDRHQNAFHQKFNGLVHLGPVCSLSRASYLLGRS